PGGRLAAAAAEGGRFSAAGAPVGEAAVEHGPRLDPRRLQHAGGYRGARPALTDRDDGAAVEEARLRRGASGAIGEMARAGDVALVPLVRLPHVEQLDRVVGEQPLELLERDRLEPLLAAALLPAGDPEQADG